MLLAIPDLAGAAVAVSVHRQTGAYRVYQAHSLSEAERLAMESCRRRSRGSTASCKVLISCERGGYGRVYHYQRGNQWAIGADCGRPSAGQVNEIAKRACNRSANSRGGRCGVRQGWYDAFNDDHVPDFCKNRHPSNDPCYRPD